jgi:putative hydrolase of the HAD superfamily
MAYVAERCAQTPDARAIRRLRQGAGRALTNNWKREESGGRRHARCLRARPTCSRVAGGRPAQARPRIYTLACDALGVAPGRTAFLDDIGRNLKPARALGMMTIKVDDPDQALRELETLVGFALA